MIPLSTLEDLERLYTLRGELNYGEGVTQIEHALQCAALAEAGNPSVSFIVAALLHDVGHLFENEEDAIKFTSDDRHQTVGARVLAPLFGDAVCAPIALHVDAKRYLCFKEPRYFGALSEASQASLKLQGGPFDILEAAAFEMSPHWRAAVALRRIDDSGKRKASSKRSFEDFMPLMRSLLRHMT